MIAIRLVCAWDALEVTREIARLLGAEGFVVSTAAGRSALEELEDAARGGECRVIVWSLDGASSPYVWRWIEDAGDGPLIEIEIAKDVAPALAGRSAAPIDFSHWRGVRGGGDWKELEERLRFAIYGKAPPPSLRRQAAVVFGALAVAAGGGAAVMRMVDAGTQQAQAAPQAPAQPIVEDLSAMGGPETFSISLDDPDFTASRLPRAHPLPDATVADAPLAEADIAAPMTFRDRSLMDTLRRGGGG